MNRASIAAAAFGLLTVSASCNRKSIPSAPRPDPSASTVPDASGATGGSRADDVEAAAREDALRSTAASLTIPIPFDFDDYDLGIEARSILDQKIGILRANPDVRVRVTGHADERGSDEYNLALGQRRAAAAKQYLTLQGIAAERIEIATAGEERSMCHDSSESCWARNRRAEFVVTSGRISVSLQ